MNKRDLLINYTKDLKKEYNKGLRKLNHIPINYLFETHTVLVEAIKIYLIKYIREEDNEKKNS